MVAAHDMGHADFRNNDGRGRLKQRTLVLIRWIAVAGQAAAICVVQFGIGHRLPLVPALAVVAASAALNIVVGRWRNLRSLLSDGEATLYLGYDMVQLSVLLYLTGGLVNPFAVLILAPVIVSSTVLSRASTIGLGLLAGACISLLAVAHLPLPWREGSFEPPTVYVLGIWLALVLSTLFIAAYVGSVSEEARRMSQALTAIQLALAREQRLASLGALAAAAAHELGSPLATIALTSNELARELPEGSALRADAELLMSRVPDAATFSPSSGGRRERRSGSRSRGCRFRRSSKRRRSRTAIRPSSSSWMQPRPRKRPRTCPSPSSRVARDPPWARQSDPECRSVLPQGGRGTPTLELFGGHRRGDG